MDTVTDQTFTGETIALDGKLFVRCRFVGCSLVVTGEQEFGVQDCDFDGMRFAFRGPAARVVSLARQLKRGGLDIIGEAQTHDA